MTVVEIGRVPVSLDNAKRIHARLFLTTREFDDDLAARDLLQRWERVKDNCDQQGMTGQRPVISNQRHDQMTQHPISGIQLLSGYTQRQRWTDVVDMLEVD